MPVKSVIADPTAVASGRCTDDDAIMGHEKLTNIDVALKFMFARYD
jgi:hypothetical protein